MSSTPKELILDTLWLAKRSAAIPESGVEITSPGFNTDDWLEAVVPGTVLTTLLKNGLEGYFEPGFDPYYGENAAKIPDIYVVGREFYTYWFVNDFSLPEVGEEGERVWLHFRGINYAADVYVNGEKVNDQSLEGMFLRHRLDITNFAIRPGVNRLAVLVNPVFHPGNVSHGGQGGDHQIAHDVTAQYVEGWDWVIPVPDRNTGIWDQVMARVTGPVVIRDPHVVTDVPGIRFPGEQSEPAYITISADLENASEVTRRGRLVCVLEENTYYSDYISIQPGGTFTHTFHIEIEKPRLWWPNGVGSQELYFVELAFVIDQHIVSDSEGFRFGIRQIETYRDQNTKGQGRVFEINGQKILMKGGNWITPDALLRNTAKRYRDEVRFHAEMNLNMIRVWGGSIAERPEFYDACDEYGVMVMQEFWMTGDCNNNNPDCPDNPALYLECAADTVKMLRNHPSLLFWCGGNELHTYLPPADIENALRNDIIPNLDGTRLYIRTSVVDGLGSGSSAGSMDGPYGIEPLSAFFAMQTCGFNPEVGSVGTPTIESLRRFLSEDALKASPYSPTPNAEWAFHRYIPYSDLAPTQNVACTYTPPPPCPDQIEAYGPLSQADQSAVEEFAFRAQMANYIQYKALYEGINKNMWRWYSGVLAWKSQNPWSGLRGQFYDWYMQQTGGFFGIRKACEPIHVQLNLDDFTLCVVNNTFAPLGDVTVKATVYDLKSVVVTAQSEPFQVEANSSSVGGPLNMPENPGIIVYFIKLELVDYQGLLLSENFYWWSTLQSEYQSLQSLSEVGLKASVRVTQEGSEYAFKANLQNPSPDTVALFIQLKLLKDDRIHEKDIRVLPTFYADNYFSLLPGEEKSVIVRCAQVDAGDYEPNLYVDGWNIAPMQIPKV